MWESIIRNAYPEFARYCTEELGMDAAPSIEDLIRWYRWIEIRQALSE